MQTISKLAIFILAIFQNVEPLGHAEAPSLVEQVTVHPQA